LFKVERGRRKTARSWSRKEEGMTAWGGGLAESA